jgi:hypothetical protein
LKHTNTLTHLMWVDCVCFHASDEPLTASGYGVVALRMLGRPCWRTG